MIDNKTVSTMPANATKPLITFNCCQLIKKHPNFALFCFQLPNPTTMLTRLNKGLISIVTTVKIMLIRILVCNKHNTIKKPLFITTTLTS